MYQGQAATPSGAEPLLLPITERPHALGPMHRRLDAAKRIGRASAKYEFHFRADSLSGLPDIPAFQACKGLQLQLSRGQGKLHSTALVAAKQSGCVSWGGEVIPIHATLRASKMGKGNSKLYSDKVFRISLIGVFDRRLRELARSEINLSLFTDASIPASRSMQLVPKSPLLSALKLPLLLHFQIVSMEAGAGDDDSDIGGSETTRTTGGSGSTAAHSASVATGSSVPEQDLAGFEPVRSAAAQGSGGDGGNGGNGGSGGSGSSSFVGGGNGGQSSTSPMQFPSSVHQPSSTGKECGTSPPVSRTNLKRIFEDDAGSRGVSSSSHGVSSAVPSHRIKLWTVEAHDLILLSGCCCSQASLLRSCPGCAARPGPPHPNPEQIHP